ncbi:MAG: hypothetical protein ACPL4H_10565 [Anaerolineales bacterium]
MVTDLVWLGVLVPSFVLVQRQVHREAQSLFYNLTQRMDIALVIFSLLLLPGVIIHELSHLCMAKILGVSIGRFSLIPKALPNGKLRLGYVETEKVDFLRDSLIGFAPLFVGSVIVGVIGVSRLHLPLLLNTFTQNPYIQIKPALNFLIHQTDFWMWFYFVFAISSSMIPSASDRRSWFLILIFVLLIALMAWLLGGGSWLMTRLRAPSRWSLRAFNLVIGLSLITHLLVWLPLGILRHLTD